MKLKYFQSFTGIIFTKHYVKRTLKLLERRNAFFIEKLEQKTPIL